MRPLPFMRSSSRQGFTLIELLAAMAVLIVLLGIIVGVTNSVSLTMRRASAGVDTLASARAGFDLLNRTLAKATLNTYWEYDNPLNPTVYLRQSDLQFVIRQNTQKPGYGQEVYFVAPETYAENAGLRSTQGLLNGCSVFVRYGGSGDFQPGTVATEKFRYRLMFGLQPTEELGIFRKPARTSFASDALYRTAVQAYWDGLAWIDPVKNDGAAGHGPEVTPLADNIIAVVAWPRLSTGEDASGGDLTTGGKFAYNSQANALAVPQPITANQLPPVIQITMIAISEASAVRLDTGNGSPPAEIEAALAGKFSDVSKYKDDLNDVVTALASKHIEFQVFSTSVPLRESKWSRAQ